MPQALHTANIHLNDQREEIVIAKKLCVTRMTVQRTVERYQDLGIANDRPRNGKAPLVFVEKNVRIDAKYYQADILLKAVVFWSSGHFGSQNWTLQQDCVPVHEAKTTVEPCRQKIPDFLGKDIWRSNPLDLNPMDFAI
uniref:Transposase n=1 Tax=Heterorhabditis bacteriophora TaxID=37862 RepID=A0A1I7X8W2_HETBA